MAPTISGRPTEIYLTVYGGPFVVIALSFGDGNHTALYVTPDEGQMLTSDASDEPDHLTGYVGPVYKYHVMSYTYQTTGDFEVIANVSNSVSHNITSSMTAVVQEPIAQVRIFTTSPSVVPTGDIVEVVATVGSGLNLQFDWDFFDTPQEPTVTM